MAAPRGTTASEPAGAGARPELAYVANNGSATVTPIRIATGTALRPVKVGGFPGAILITVSAARS